LSICTLSQVYNLYFKMNLLLLSTLLLAVIQCSAAQDFTQYTPRSIDDQMQCLGTADALLSLEYVQFTNPVTGDIISPCYPNTHFQPVQVNRKVWHLDVVNAVAYRITINVFVGGYGDDAPSAVLYYSDRASQDPGAPSLVVIGQDYAIYGNESVPAGDERLTQENLITKAKVFPSPGDFIEFTGTQMFFTYVHDLESITGRFNLTYRPDINQCAATISPPYCSNNGVCSRASFANYVCACPPNWAGDRCTVDVDECALNTDNCSPFATCTNLPGLFQCICNTGYSGDGVTCQAIVCPALATPANGQAPSCTSDANFGSVCTFVCNAGYTLSGSATTECGGDGSSVTGTWSNPVPTCEPFVCPGLPLPVNGLSITCTDGANFNSACTFTCNPGFGIVGAQVLTCVAQGTTIATSYDNAVPTCEPIVCPALSAPANGNTPSCTNANNYGSQCTFSCLAGFDLVGQSVLTCQGNGSSTVGSYNFAAPTCAVSTCDTFVAPANGVLSCTDGSNYGSQCTYTCNTGFGISGASAVLTCGTGATVLATGYDFAAPTCAVITCPALAAPANGNAPSCTNTNLFNSVCSFTCQTGFSLVGNADLTCTGDGSSNIGAFNSAPPTCEAITCPPLAVPVNGLSVTCSGANSVGVQCTFVCNTGFGIVGAAVLTCVAGTGTVGTYNLPPPTCAAITCPALGALANGAVSCSDANNFGSVCTSSCNAGFFLDGTATSTCVGDGSSATGAYNTALPTCVAITCPAFAAPANGAVSCSNSVNFGSVCTFTCNAGYAVNGAVTSTCGAGAGTSATGSFDAAAPTCGDVNECADATLNNCDVNAFCTDTAGSFTCTCNPGYTGAGTTGTCINVNECADATLNNCDVNAVCTDTVGSYTCTCNTGYTGDGFTCTDINECADPALNNCGANAICTNTLGSYDCTCAVGYTGDGITCVDINECALTPAVCDVNAICLNVEGSYSCNCNAGYTGTGIPGDCVDINECTSGATACSANAVCSNTIGSFTCACATGYERQSGDGGPPAPESLICVGR